MKKVVSCALLLGFFLIPAADAAVYKGQKLYVMKCRGCHGLGQVFITAKTQDEWENLMKRNGEPIARLHLKSQEAKETWEYFEGADWKRNARHIHDFMIEYAADSGNVPACE